MQTIKELKDALRDDLSWLEDHDAPAPVWAILIGAAAAAKKSVEWAEGLNEQEHGNKREAA